MTKYLISFPAPAMDIPEEDWVEVGEAARAAIREAKHAGCGYDRDKRAWVPFEPEASFGTHIESPAVRQRRGRPVRAWMCARAGAEGGSCLAA